MSKGKLSTQKASRKRKLERQMHDKALLLASEEGDETEVERLLDKGADVNAEGGEYGSALQAASQGGHEKVVQLLLDKGADVNARGGEYWSALVAASYRGHPYVVELLLDKGADVNIGRPLKAAATTEISKMLMAKGAEW